MNKNKFLKELEKKLQILDKTEINDILSEYGSIIDEKVKDGKTEEEAVSDFGSLDELAKEILSAYKINPDYNDKKSNVGDKTKTFVEDCEDLIKRGANKLSEFTNEVVDNFKNDKNQNSNAAVFEIIIKIVILLIIISILRLPFLIFGKMGEAILGIGGLQYSNIPVSIWRFLIEIAYFAVSILIIVIVVKRYVEPNDNINSKNVSTKKQSTNKYEKSKKNTIEEKKYDNNISSVEAKKTKKNTQTDDDSVSSVLFVLLKVFAILFLIVPLSFVVFGLAVALSIVVYLVFKGAPLVGLIVFLIGCIGLYYSFIALISSVLFTKSKVYIFPIFVNIILMLCGGIMFVDTALNFNYYNEVPKNNLSVETKEYTFNLNDDTYITTDNGDIEVFVDNSIEDYKIRVVVNYHDEFVEDVIVRHKDNINPRITFENEYYNRKFSYIKKTFNTVIDDIKDKNIYNYGKLFEAKVDIYVNENTKNMLNIN